jgi:hypothetical protein
MELVTREAILGLRNKRKTEAVEIPELGGVVYMRELWASERETLLPDIKDGQVIPKKNLRALLVSMSACDSEGKLMFSAGDVDALGNIPASVMDRLYTVGEKLSVLDDESRKALEGNSAAGPAGVSASA